MSNRQKFEVGAEVLYRENYKYREGVIITSVIETVDRFGATETTHFYKVSPSAFWRRCVWLREDDIQGLLRAEGR